MASDSSYQKAEKAIRKVRASGDVALDLGGMGLGQLPKSLGRLPYLQSLDLSSNKLTTLPEWLSQFTQLRNLNLSNNKFSALSSWLGQFTQLEDLDLSNNGLTALPEWLGRLSQLRRLRVARCQLSSLPDWLGHFRELDKLDISDNELTVLPDWLGDLTELRWLNLSNAGLTALPERLGDLRRLRHLYLFGVKLQTVPEWIAGLTELENLGLSDCGVAALPEWMGHLAELRSLSIAGLKLKFLPDWLRRLVRLERLYAYKNELAALPDWLGELGQLGELHLFSNSLSDLPVSLASLSRLAKLDLSFNPLNPELAAADEEGLAAVMRYLRAKTGPQVVLNEAKLILIGEGEIGKSCLLGALRGDPWIEGRPTTHGIEIKPVQVTNPDTGIEITLNGWDFGGQRVYRPTHQLFFSSPAVYLVVWKPREGPQQGFVREWISLVKHREPDAKILVVATHGGVGQRQPDVDRQEIWDLFGRDTILDFFLVDSKPNENGERRGIPELKDAIARLAATLPEVGRKVPARWKDATDKLEATGSAYLPLERALEICRKTGMNEEEAGLFITVSHRLGHLIHYEHDAALRDIVVLKPDWLATAMSLVLDDEDTRRNHGLVKFERLGQLWNDPAREKELRYPPKLHPVFLRLMERFDLSYRVAGFPDEGESSCTSLIAQLVPDVRPDISLQWPAEKAEGDGQQMQICEIVESTKGQSAPAEGLFYQLIVRLHKYSLGRAKYDDSVHWQRGLVLDADYNGRALLEHVGNDVRITVRAPYPERFLAVLTSEVKWLVENFWSGLRCDVMVPCVEPCGRKAPGTGLFEVRKLIESKKKQRPEYPCPVCNEWQDIDHLLRNAPAAQRLPLVELVDVLSGLTDLSGDLGRIRMLLIDQQGETMGRFDKLDIGQRRMLSKIDDAYSGFMHALTDEAKDGPRLFSFEPVKPGFFDRPKWMNEKFRLTLWCEHSRLPLPSLNGADGKKGVYELSIPREWFVKAAPYLKVLATTLSLVLPVASSATKLLADDSVYKRIEKELEFGEKSAESVIKGGEDAGEWLGVSDAPDVEHGSSIRAHGAALRQLHAWLKEKDPSFGGLVRVQNKRQEFLWVHPQFEGEY
jgi:Leucine-rich repeat (LRR) protein